MDVKIYTKTGDTGETELLYGGRVSKTDPRVEVYGAVDETVSAMGLARALSRDDRVRALLDDLQRELFTVAAELATDAAAYDRFTTHFKPITAEMTERLETTLDDMMEEVKLPPAFIVPGGSPASAAMDVARTVARRAERRVVDLKDMGLLVNQEVLRYVNRLADLLFMLARYEDRALPPYVLTGGRR